ncbi:MAG: hypothetical protein GY938_05045 [Ketobacter sp.]|nr:hypothetical protein [Ketobacter sp.]
MPNPLMRMMSMNEAMGRSQPSGGGQGGISPMQLPGMAPQVQMPPQMSQMQPQAPQMPQVGTPPQQPDINSLLGMIFGNRQQSTPRYGEAGSGGEQLFNNAQGNPLAQIQPKPAAPPQAEQFKKLLGQIFSGGFGGESSDGGGYSTGGGYGGLGEGTGGLY